MSVILSISNRLAIIWQIQTNPTAADTT